MAHYIKLTLARILSILNINKVSIAPTYFTISDTDINATEFCQHPKQKMQ